MDVKSGDWVFFKGDPDRTWHVHKVYPKGVLDDGEGRVIVTLHDSVGMMGANLPLASVDHVATQRELLASPQFQWGYPRILRETVIL